MHSEFTKAAVILAPWLSVQWNFCTLDCSTQSIEIEERHELLIIQINEVIFFRKNFLHLAVVLVFDTVKYSVF